MSDEAEKMKWIQSILRAAMEEKPPAGVRDAWAELVAIDPRSAYPYMSKQEFNEMMEARQKKP